MAVKKTTVKKTKDDEVDNLMSMATALGIDDSRAILMLVDMAKEEDIVIEF